MYKAILLSYLFTIISFAAFCQQQTYTLYLDELDMNKISTQFGNAQANKSIDGATLSINGEKFEHGIATHALSKFMLNLDKKGLRLTAKVGVDDEKTAGSVVFYLIGDNKVIFESGVMKYGAPAKSIDVSLRGIKKLGFIVTDGGDGITSDHADWGDAKIEYGDSVLPKFIDQAVVSVSEKFILTPKSAETPRINGAKITGASPYKPFLYTIAATGIRPMTFATGNLPLGLTLDATTGIISGKVSKVGKYKVKLIATNSKGTAKRDLNIVISEGKLALTPPMGWSSWNCWGTTISEEKVKSSANAMITSGLINHGYTYINIDDGWESEKRTAKGEITGNEKFPDMKQLAYYIHSKGLKFGIYSSPGEKTCGGYPGSFGHEEQDAATFAKWGIDYLKYDLCNYVQKMPANPTFEDGVKPYQIMGDALKKQNHDIVHALCQFGHTKAPVWEWGAKVGQLWRVNDDIRDVWKSLYECGFYQTKNTKYAGPSSWNDPDMLVVGRLGLGFQQDMHESRLSADEQYTHISLWSLLAAPLLIGCDMSRLDEFTLNLLSNDEVLNVDQDILGKQAARIKIDSKSEVWVKDLEDGSKAVGLFQTFPIGNPVNYFYWDNEPTTISISWKELGISGKQTVRDLWRQKDLGSFADRFEVKVAYHGVVLVKISPSK